MPLLLSAGAAYATPFGDDVEANDWLPIPDGYVWPAAAQGAPELIPKDIPLSSLPDSVRKEFSLHKTNGREAKSVLLLQCDLNDDSKEEMLLEVPILNGTAGTFYLILTPGDNGVRSVGALQGYGFILRERKNGWFQIEAASRGGGGNYTRYLITFDGKEYVTSRNERHDFNRGKVEIRN